MVSWSHDVSLMHLLESLNSLTLVEEMSVEKNTLLNFSNLLIIHVENTKEINV